MFDFDYDHLVRYGKVARMLGCLNAWMLGCLDA